MKWFSQYEKTFTFFSFWDIGSFLIFYQLPGEVLEPTDSDMWLLTNSPSREVSGKVCDSWQLVFRCVDRSRPIYFELCESFMHPLPSVFHFAFSQLHTCKLLPLDAHWQNGAMGQFTHHVSLSEGCRTPSIMVYTPVNTQSKEKGWGGAGSKAKWVLWGQGLSVCLSRSPFTGSNRWVEWTIWRIRGKVVFVLPRNHHRILTNFLIFLYTHLWWGVVHLLEGHQFVSALSL